MERAQIENLADVLARLMMNSYCDGDAWHITAEESREGWRRSARAVIRQLRRKYTITEKK